MVGYVPRRQDACMVTTTVEVSQGGMYFFLHVFVLFAGILFFGSTPATSTDILIVKMTPDETFDRTLQKEQLENLPSWVSEFSKDLRGIRYPSQ